MFITKIGSERQASERNPVTACTAIGQETTETQTGAAKEA